MTVLVLALACLLLPSCRTTQEEAISPELQKVLDGMGLENAPTLGPLYREYLIYSVEGKTDKLYDMMGSAAQKQLSGRLQWETKRYQDEVKADEEKLSRPDISEQEKAKVASELQNHKKHLADLQACNGDPAKLMALEMQREYPNSGFLEELKKSDTNIIGEKITGNTGSIKLTSKIILDVPQLFIKENGTWKVDLPRLGGPRP
jgi:hypothetical protein